MTSSSMPEQEHRPSSPETLTMASGEQQPQLPGLVDAAAGRSDVATMLTTGGGAGVMGAEGPLGDGGVLIVSMPGGPLVLAPTPLSFMKHEKEVSAHPCPEKQCVECGATETPQWRMHPTGQGAICCNACRIRLRPAEALREPVRVHLPPPATAAISVSESPAGGWISEAGMDSDAYLLTVTASEEKNLKRKRKPYHPWKSSKQCHHCKSASTPQWRMGPTGPGTLCNACGVRYREGRLVEEYRPAASPNFEPSEHACKHREVLQLRQKKQRGEGQQQQPPLPAAAMQPRAGDGMEQQHLPPPPAQAHAGGDGLLMGEPLLIDDDDDNLLLDDKFLFNGPAAPLLIDDDEETASPCL